jgi:hypothetical protein
MVVDFEKVLHFHSASLPGSSGYRTVLIENTRWGTPARGVTS